MINIITLDFPIQGKGITNISFDGLETLLDADLVIIDPSKISQKWANSNSFNSSGNPLINAFEGRLIINMIERRRREIEILLEQNKVIIVFACPVKEFETGVWQNDINAHVTRYSNNYDFLPNLSFLPFLQEGYGSGSNPIILKDPKNLFSLYFKAFKDELNYSVYLDMDENPKQTFLINRSAKPVGFLSNDNTDKGLVAYLPYPSLKVDKTKLSYVLIECVNKYFQNNQSTLPPIWVIDYKVPGENELVTKIKNIEEELHKIKREKDKVEKDKNELIKFKNLLFEQGSVLEKIVIDSFKLFGFDAENRKIHDLEHDIVFKSSEGKGIAELEGKDNDAVNISKFDQLNRAVDEDFDLTGEYAQGVLIGNHYRLISPNLRKNPFTEKVLTVARKKRFGLLTTLEIYKAIEKILQNPEDEIFKQSCREKILKTEGEVINLV